MDGYKAEIARTRLDAVRCYDAKLKKHALAHRGEFNANTQLLPSREVYTLVRLLLFIVPIERASKI